MNIDGPQKRGDLLYKDNHSAPTGHKSTENLTRDNQETPRVDNRKLAFHEDQNFYSLIYRDESNPSYNYSTSIGFPTYYYRYQKMSFLFILISRLFVSVVILRSSHIAAI